MTGIHVVQVGCAPNQAVHDMRQIGGAYVNVYTTRNEIHAAIDLALSEVSDAGWIAIRVVSAAWSTEEDFGDSESGRAYFKQALIDGIVLVAHTFPPEFQQASTFIKRHSWSQADAACVQALPTQPYPLPELDFHRFSRREAPCMTSEQLPLTTAAIAPAHHAGTGR